MTSSHQPEQPEQPPEVSERVPWTTAQRSTITAGVVTSVILWVLTPLAHDAHSFLSNLAWTLAAVSTLSVASYAWFMSDRNRREARDRAQDARDRRQDERVQRLYDRQEELAGEILSLLRAEAEAMEVRHRRFTEELLKKQADMAETQLNTQAASFKVLLDRQRQNSDAMLKTMEKVIGPIAESIDESLSELTGKWDEYNALVRKVRSRVGDVSQALRSVAALVSAREQSSEERFRRVTLAAEHLEEMLNAHALVVGGRLPDAKVRSIKRPPNEGQNGS